MQELQQGWGNYGERKMVPTAGRGEETKVTEKSACVPKESSSPKKQGGIGYMEGLAWSRSER